MSNVILIFVASAYIGYLIGRNVGFSDGADKAMHFITAEILFALKDDHNASSKVLRHLGSLSEEGNTHD